MENPCCKCKTNERSPGQRWCRGCRAEWMREHRPKHSALPIGQRVKATARAYANVYQRRGKLVPGPCEVCGSVDTEKHHDDYSRPLAVRWLCRVHHLEIGSQHLSRET